MQHNEMELWNLLVYQPSISILESEPQLLFVGICKGHLRIYSFSAEQNTVQIGKGQEKNALITGLSSKQSTELAIPVPPRLVILSSWGKKKKSISENRRYGGEGTQQKSSTF